jgi:hypothetical protein
MMQPKKKGGKEKVGSGGGGFVDLAGQILKIFEVAGGIQNGYREKHTGESK